MNFAPSTFSALIAATESTGICFNLSVSISIVTRMMRRGAVSPDSSTESTLPDTMPLIRTGELGAERGRVAQVRVHDGALRKQAASPRQQKDQHAENHQGGDGHKPDAQLRPSRFMWGSHVRVSMP
jgi:hypothetical protein